MLKKIALGFVVLITLVIVVAAGAYLVTEPEAPAASAPASTWLVAGPYAVATQDRTFEDTTRPTDANDTFGGSDSRLLESTIWYPVDAAGLRPLVVYSHGFMSNRTGGTYIAEALASYGYVVVAANYPLTTGAAPGGPLVTDVINQPGDVSFLIDAISDGSAEIPIAGIDDTRIGVAGLSLGGLTSTLAGYHPRWLDDRIDAVVSIAGPAYMFAPQFFENSTAPFLMIAGTLDAIVHYPENASDIPSRVRGGGLVTIAGGSHIGFADIAEPFLRFANNGDGLGCDAILSTVDGGREANPFLVLGTVEEGVVFPEEQPGLCTMSPLPESIHPGRQHMITQVAVLSFFQSHFAPSNAERTEAATLLREGLAASFAETNVTFSP